MEQWKTDPSTGERTKTLTHGSITIVLHRPALAESERHRREESIKTALAPFARGRTA